MPKQLLSDKQLVLVDNIQPEDCSYDAIKEIFSYYSDKGIKVSRKELTRRYFGDQRLKNNSIIKIDDAAYLVTMKALVSNKDPETKDIVRRAAVRPVFIITPDKITRGVLKSIHKNQLLEFYKNFYPKYDVENHDFGREINETARESEIYQLLKQNSEVYFVKYDEKTGEYITIDAATKIEEVNRVYLLQERCVMDLFEFATDFEALFELSTDEEKTNIIASLLIQLIDKVMELHALGYRHGDLKLDNVMIGTDGMLKLIDFGSARNKTDEDQITCGTEYYVAPEYIKNNAQYLWEQDEKIRKEYFENCFYSGDLYSVGAIISYIEFYCVKDEKIKQNLQVIYKSMMHEDPKRRMTLLNAKKMLPAIFPNFIPQKIFIPTAPKPNIPLVLKEQITAIEQEFEELNKNHKRPLFFFQEKIKSLKEKYTNCIRNAEAGEIQAVKAQIIKSPLVNYTVFSKESNTAKEVKGIITQACSQENKSNKA